MNEAEKLKVYKKWMATGFKQPSTREDLDIIKELWSKGNTEKIKKKNQEFERSIKYWDEYLKKNQGKITNGWPKTFLDKDEKWTKTIVEKIGIEEQANKIQ
jgi:hypothetical protein